MDEQASDCFLEAKILAALRDHRALIVSSLMKRTSHLLAMLQAGAQEKVMRLLHRSLGNHSKRRCNDYPGLMYPMMLAGEQRQVIDRALEELYPQFVSRIATLNSVSLETARESNPIATCLAALSTTYRHALEADRESTARLRIRGNLLFRRAPPEMLAYDRLCYSFPETSLKGMPRAFATPSP